MSNRHFLMIVVALLAIMFILVLIEQAGCQNSDGSPCRFGGAGRGGVRILP